MSVTDFQLLELLSSTFPDEPWSLKDGEMYLARKADEYKRRLKEGRALHPVTEEAIADGKRIAGAIEVAKAKAQVLTLEQVTAHLQQAIEDGATDLQIEQLIVRLAENSAQSTATLYRLRDTLQAEVAGKARIAAEAQAIAAEADRKEVGQALTPEFLLPPMLAGAITTRTRYLPTDGPSAVLPFLTAMAGLVQLGTTVVGNPIAGAEVPANLFCCLVGRSGAKKSPTSRLLVKAPLADLIKEQAEANAYAHQQWLDACRDAKAAKEPMPPEPKPVKIEAAEITGESLTDQLMTQEKAGRGLLLHRDELAGLFAGMNQYRGGKGSDEQQMLEIYDGGGLTSLRITSSRSYTRSQMSIWGTTQPEVLRQLVAAGDASGLWARFMFVPLPERVVPLPMQSSPSEMAEVQAAAQLLADVARTIHDLPPRRYNLTDEALAVWQAYELQHQGMALKASIGAQSALYGKSAGKVLRVAGLLHLLKVAIGEEERDALVGADCISRGAVLVDHLDQWALSLHSEVAVGETTGLMQTIHRVAEAAGGPIRWKEVQNRLSKVQRRDADAATGQAAMRALAAAGYGVIEEGPRGSLSYRAIGALP